MAVSGPMTLNFQALCDSFGIFDSIFMCTLCLHVKCAEALVLVGFCFQLFYMLYSARTRRENMESCVWSCPVVTRLRASGSDAGNCLRATAPPSQSSKARVEEHSYGRVSSGPHRRLTSKTLSIALITCLVSDVAGLPA